MSAYLRPRPKRRSILPALWEQVIAPVLMAAVLVWAAIEGIVRVAGR